MSTATQPETRARALINGKKYKIELTQDMALLPGLSETFRDIYILRGPRGAVYTLQVRHDGTFELLDRKCRTKASGEWK